MRERARRYTPSVCSAVASHENSWACTSAPAASRARSASSQATRRSAAAQASGSWPGDEQPAVAVAHDGGQAADRGGDHRGAAGLGLDGDQAERLVVGGHGDQRWRRRTSGPARSGSPAARTGRRRSMPSSSARAARAVGRSRPLPEGPPTTGTTSRERRPGSRSSRTATARSSTSGALSGWIRPANISTTASRGQARARRGPRPRRSGGRRRGRRRGARPRRGRGRRRRG